MKKEATIYKTPYPDLYREASNLNRFKYSGSVIGKSCEGCKCSLFCRSKEYSFEVKNPSNINVDSGDKVLIEMPTGRTILSSFMSLFFPLICFFIPLFVSAAFFTANEIYQFLSALIGLAVGFLISFIYFKRRKKYFEPTIIEKKDDK